LISQAAIAPFEKKRTAIVKAKSGEFLGELDEMRAEVRKNLKLPEYIAGFELDVNQLLKLRQGTKYQPLSRFPSTSQDISLKVSCQTTYGQVADLIADNLKKAEDEHGYNFSLTPVDIYQNEKAK